MEDCAKGASYLAHEKKIVDPKRLVISGGSAGGYVVLASLTFTDVFAAGSSHYGISDIVVLIKETHKFESRYIDNLLLPGDKGLKLARERSPIYHLDSLKKPIAFFQGELDKVLLDNMFYTHSALSIVYVKYKITTIFSSSKRFYSFICTFFECA